MSALPESYHYSLEIGDLVRLKPYHGSWLVEVVQVCLRPIFHRRVIATRIYADITVAQREVLRVGRNGRIKVRRPIHFAGPVNALRPSPAIDNLATWWQASAIETETSLTSMRLRAKTV